MSARRYLYWVRESSYGTAASTPVVGTDSMYIRLSEGDNAFQMEEDPVEFDIPYGGGFSTLAETGADQFECKGSLETNLYPSQAALLLNWCATRVNAARDEPWTTTDASAVMPPGDLASASLIDVTQLSDGTYEYVKYQGAKVGDWKLAAGVQGEARKVKLTLQLMAQKRVASSITEAPAPAETDYPTGPYLLSHVTGTNGMFKIGTNRTMIEGFTIGATNNVDVRYYESQYATLMKFTGRQGTLEADLRLKVTPDDRAAYVALTSLATKLALDNGAITTAIDFKAQNTIGKYARSWPLNREFGYKLNLKNRFDPSAAADLAVAVTANA